MNRSVPYLLVILFVIPMAQAAETETKTTARLNLRRTPEVNTENIVRTLPRGERLRVIAKRGEWLQVETRARVVGWVSRAFVRPSASRQKQGAAATGEIDSTPRSSPATAAPAVDMRIRCEMLQTRDDLGGEYRYIVQAFATRGGGTRHAVSEQFAISAHGIPRSEGPDDETYKRFVTFVREHAGAPCGNAAQRDPNATVPPLKVIEAPDVVAYEGRCKVRLSTRLNHGFVEDALQATVRSGGVEHSVTYRYAISAENLPMGDQPLSGDEWLLLEHVKQEARLSDVCRSR